MKYLQAKTKKYGVRIHKSFFHYYLLKRFFIGSFFAFYLYVLNTKAFLLLLKLKVEQEYDNVV